MLDGFIKKFVLCEKCENPETVIKVKKNLVGASCRACGHAYVMDMRHKLTTFILKVILAPDWTRQITGSEYWALIGRDRSCDLNTGL